MNKTSTFVRGDFIFKDQHYSPEKAIFWSYNIVHRIHRNI